MNRQTRSRRRPVLESLESRQLYAVDFTQLSQPFDVKGVNGYRELVVLDSNGDGKRDDLFFWTPGSGENRLLQGAVTTNRSPSPGIDPRAINGAYTVAVSGDFDGDGKQDDLFFWRPVDGDSRTMFNHGNGNWDALTDVPGKGAVNGYTNVSSGDFDGDGAVDDLFFWQSRTGGSRVLLGNGRGRWDVVTEPIDPRGINGYQQMVVGDFDEDGRQDDIFFWSADGSNRTAFGRSARAYDLVTESVGRGAVNGYTELAVGDFDNDSRSDDILFRVAASGETRLLFGGGQGQWKTLTRPMNPDWVNGYGRSIVGDFDADGRQDDLFLWTPGHGTNRAVMGQWYRELPGVGWTAGELSVTGNNQGNRIDLQPLARGFQVTLDGQTQFLPPAYTFDRLTVRGEGGDDVITNYSSLLMTAYGGAGNDTLNGGSGEDRLDGGLGNDILRGNHGNDTYVFTAAGSVSEIDFVGESAGAGEDALDFSALQTGVRVDLDRTSSAATHAGRTIQFLSTRGIEIVRGGAGDDEIWGSDFVNELLLGNGGRDLLNGRGGDDRLFGGAGNDTLRGGNGNDRLYGDGDIDALFGDAGNDWLEAGSAIETAEGGGGWDFNAHRWAIDGTTSNDIDQGGSGTCWFLAALSSVARNTDLSGRIRYLGNFRFEVTIYHRDTGALQRQTVVFDGTTAPADADVIDKNATSATDEYWVILMNRAALQSMGVNYLDFQRARDAGGTHEKGLRAVTGRNPTLEDGERFSILRDLTDAEYLAVIRNALNQGRAVTADRYLRSNDLVAGGHSYSVLSVSGNNITIRNPWAVDSNGQAGIITQGANDGYVTLTMSQFRRVFDGGVAFA